MTIFLFIVQGQRPDSVHRLLASQSHDVRRRGGGRPRASALQPQPQRGQGCPGSGPCQDAQGHREDQQESLGLGVRPAQGQRRHRQETKVSLKFKSKISYHSPSIYFYFKSHIKFAGWVNLPPLFPHPVYHNKFIKNSSSIKKFLLSLFCSERGQLSQPTSGLGTPPLPRVSLRCLPETGASAREPESSRWSQTQVPHCCQIASIVQCLQILF